MVRGLSENIFLLLHSVNRYADDKNIIDILLSKLYANY